MNIKQNKELCESIVKLQDNPHWQRVVTAIGDEGERLVESMIVGAHDDATLRELKGRAAAYTSILRAIGEARDMLAKFEVNDG
jgi:hypothetical protein